MSRSIWKNVFVDSVLLYNVLAYENTSIYTTNSRGSTIVNEFVGKSFSIHTGKKYFVLSISEIMVGFKFGELVHTKKICIYRKTKKVSKKYAKKK